MVPAEKPARTRVMISYGAHHSLTAQVAIVMLLNRDVEIDFYPL